MAGSRELVKRGTSSPAKMMTKENSRGLGFQCSPDAESEIMQWIEELTEHRADGQSIAQWLRSGKVLCDLANALRPGSVKRVHDCASPFKEMENIAAFVRFARDMGLPESSLFATPDLHVGRSILAVLVCLLSLRAAADQKPGR